MNAEMGALSEARARSLGFRGYSTYVQSLIRRDLMEQGAMVLREGPLSTEAKPPTEPVTYQKPRAARKPNAAPASSTREYTPDNLATAALAAPLAGAAPLPPPVSPPAGHVRRAKVSGPRQKNPSKNEPS